MNKIMLFPLFFLVLLTFFVSINSATHYIGETPDYSEIGGEQMYINETPSSVVELSSAGPIEVNIWGLAGAILTLFAAISIGIISGLNVFSTGLSVESQKLLFQGTLFLGLWGTLSIAIVELISSSQWITLFWIMLTIMFAVGFGMDMAGEG